VVSSNPDLKDVITQHRIELLDLTISILSAKSLVDLEVPGAKNLLRHDLLESFNQNLKSNVIEQLYFSEFVIQ
jgi:flagellar basal body-associated protein FliL